MIRPLSPKRTRVERCRVRWLARRQWRAVFIPVWILDVEGFGRTLVIAQRMQTRWSDNRKRRLWRFECPTLP